MPARASKEGDNRGVQLEANPIGLGLGIERRAREFFPGVDTEKPGRHRVGVVEIDVAKVGPGSLGHYSYDAIASANGSMHAIIREHYYGRGYKSSSYFRVRGEDEGGNEIDAICNRMRHGTDRVTVRKNGVALRPGDERNSVLARLNIRSDIQPRTPVVVY
jgi:hypothetical protein